jgi:pimeloyl-ACP methyl ester carboxylesterase
MPHITLDGTKFYYQQEGSGPDVVLVHAATSNMALWMFSGVIETLSQEFRVTAYDLRGHGMSDLTPSGYTSFDMAGDLIQLSKSLQLKPAYLVGHSFGGVVSMHASILAPDMWEGIILSDSYFPGLKSIEPNLNRIPIWEKWKGMLENVGANLGEELNFEELFAAVAALSEDQMKTLEKNLDGFSLRWILSLSRLAKTSCGKDIFTESGLTLERILEYKKPLVALYDEHTGFKATRSFLKERLLDCVVEDVPAANHLAPLENPTMFNALVQKHMRRMALCTS